MIKNINKIVDILNDIPENEYSMIIECARKMASGLDLNTTMASAVNYDWSNKELMKVLEEKNSSVEKMAWILLGAKVYKGDKHLICEFIDLLRECNNTETTRAKSNPNVNGTLKPIPDEKKKSNGISPLFQ